MPTRKAYMKGRFDEMEVCKIAKSFSFKLGLLVGVVLGSGLAAVAVVLIHAV